MKISDGPQTFCLFIIDHVPFLSVVNLILSMQTVTIAYRGNQQVLCEPSFHIGGRIQSLFSTDLKFHFSKVKCHQWSRRWCYNIDDVLTIPNVSYRVWTGAAAYALWYIMYHNIISKSYTEILMHMTSQCLIEKHSNIPKLGMYGIYKIDCILTFPHISFTK